MKKVFITLSAIALIFASCTSNDDNNNNSDANALTPETTNVAFAVSTAKKTAKLTGKDVQRGNIDVKIKDITVTATKVWAGTGAPYEASEFYNLVDGQPTGVSPYFTLEKVAIGTNDFRAKTTAGGAENLFLDKQDFEPRSNAEVNEQANNWLDKLKGEIPYVVYNGEVLGKTIQKPEVGVSNNVAFNMTTQNGRITAVFSLDAFLVQQEYDVTIIAKGYTSPASKTTLFERTVGIDKGDLAKFQWSDSKSLNGALIYYVIEIREKNGSQKTPLYTYVINGGSIEASTSKSCHYTIGKEQALVDLLGNDDITFTWQQWVENANTTARK